MRRELLTPVAISLGAALVAAGCSGTDDSNSGTSQGSSPDAAVESTATLPPDPEPDAGGPDTTDSVVSPTTEPATPDTGTAGPQAFGSRLEFFGDCPALLGYMQAEALERVTPWGLDGGFIAFETDDMAVEESAEALPAEASVDVAADLAAEAPADGPSFSETNTQEIGVDEGDIVETDGEYVYVVDLQGLRIVSVADAEIAAETDLPEGDHEMLLADDRLVVVTRSWTGGPDTIVSSYDVTDPTDPTLLRRSHLEGNLVASRAADGVARLVISTSFGERLPFVNPSTFGLDEERALERNREIIEESTVEDWLPRWFDESGDGAFGPIQIALDCDDVAAPPTFSGLGLTWIASVDLEERADPVGSAGVVSSGDTVYASQQNLYIATRDQVFFGPVEPFEVPEEEGTPEGAPDEPDEPTVPPTLIHQFALGDGTDATYVASGSVPGRLLNQFAMSEHEGDLRVAATVEDRGFGAPSESFVHVLRPDGGDLETISTVGGLGRGEQIYAVRFIGDVAYVVTFRQIDPLYVLDLSDPESPVLEGELKIPGYSAYLHPVGDGLLLGVGQDATDEGRVLGTQLSLFDVSDPADPQRIDTEMIGGWSDVEWDHRAFLFWPEDGSIVLPVSPGWSDCLDGPCPADKIGPAGGAIVAELNGRDLSTRGVITHTSRASEGCWNPLRRSIAIEDELVTVGADQLRFSDRASLDERATVQWGTPEDYGCWWYWE